MKRLSFLLASLLIISLGLLWFQRLRVMDLTAQLNTSRAENLALNRETVDLRSRLSTLSREVASPPPRAAVKPAALAIQPVNSAPQSDPDAAELARLLAAVNSRETALAYLAYLAENHRVDRIPPEQRPKFQLLSDDDLSEEERRQTANAREAASKDGRRLVFMRVEGQEGLHTLSARPFAAESLPPQVRAFVTERDLQDFQDKFLYLQAENSVLAITGSAPTK